MKFSTIGVSLALFGAVLFLVACGGGSGGGNPPAGGAPVMLDVPVKWVDVNSDGLPNIGDELRVEFDRSVAMGVNAPAVDFNVLNGSLGASTWTNGPGNYMTINLAAGSVLASSPGRW